MRDKIEKLIEFWRQVADNGGGGYRHCADDLQRVLDADYVAKDSQLGCSCLCHEQDPVSKLEAMGITGLNVARDGDLTMVANVEGEHYEVPVQLASSGKVSEDIRDAATRLLARIEKEGE